MKRSDQSGQSGMTLIEMIMLLSIAGIIITFAIINFSDVLGTSETQSAQQNLLNVRISISEAYSSETNYSSLSNSEAINLKAVPSSIIRGTTLQNSFGGTITLAPNSSDNQFFDITYTSIPEAACAKMALLSRGEWQSVSVNGSDIPQTGSGGTTAAASACTSGSNTIIYTAN